MWCECGNPVENRDTGKCSSCSHADRKASKVKVKVVAPVKKVSQKRADELKEYPHLKRKYIAVHSECEVRLDECMVRSREIHHCSLSAKNFLNTDTWLASCIMCHRSLENM